MSLRLAFCSFCNIFFLIQLSDDLSRIAYSQGVVRDIVDHNSTGTYHTSVSDCHSRTDSNVPANPASLSDSNRQAVFPYGTLIRIQRMLGSIDMYSRSNQSLFPNRNFCSIENYGKGTGNVIPPAFSPYDIPSHSAGEVSFSLHRDTHT